MSGRSPGTATLLRSAFSRRLNTNHGHDSRRALSRRNRETRRSGCRYVQREGRSHQQKHAEKLHDNSATQSEGDGEHASTRGGQPRGVGRRPSRTLRMRLHIFVIHTKNGNFGSSVPRRIATGTGGGSLAARASKWPHLIFLILTFQQREKKNENDRAPEPCRRHMRDDVGTAFCDT